MHALESAENAGCPLRGDPIALQVDGNPAHRALLGENRRKAWQSFNRGSLMVRDEGLGVRPLGQWRKKMVPVAGS